MNWCSIISTQAMHRVQRQRRALAAQAFDRRHRRYRHIRVANHRSIASHSYGVALLGSAGVRVDVVGQAGALRRAPGAWRARCRRRRGRPCRGVGAGAIAAQAPLARGHRAPRMSQRFEHQHAGAGRQHEAVAVGGHRDARPGDGSASLAATRRPSHRTRWRCCRAVPRCRRQARQLPAELDQLHRLADASARWCMPS